MLMVGPMDLLMPVSTRHGMETEKDFKQSIWLGYVDGRFW
jgi:hypothetical protein